LHYENYKVEDFLADESFVNYCNTSNEEDVLQWESIINTNPQLTNNIVEAKQAIYDIQHQLAITDAKQASELFKQHFYTTYSSKNSYDNNSLVPKSFTLFRVLRASAAVLFVCFSFYTLYNYNKQELPVAVANIEKHQPYVYNTSSLQRYSVTLPDGTTVLLNYNSILTTDSTYNITDRKIFLRGEAFFDVKKDAAKPFIVVTKNSSTTALGTSFTVREYDYEKHSSVSLVTGKVAVANKLNKTVTLVPGEKVFQKNNTANLKKSVFNINEINAWKTNKLEFHNENIKAVFAKLEAHYGIVFNYNTSMHNKHYTGSFENKSLQHILDVISILNQVSFKITAKEVLIYKK
jgi:transmembrane sensor